MLIYKYVVPERIDVLEHGYMRFTQAAALNDPFETQPCLKVFKQSLENRARKLLDSLRDRVDDAGYKSVSSRIEGLAKERLARFQQGHANNYAMLSLSKKRNNLLMWSHYAASHRGFVIGFDSENPYFNREKPRAITQLRGIKYSSERLVVPALEECEECNGEELAEMFFFAKSHHWEYEEELRMLAQPKVADKVIKGDDGYDIYLYKIPTECFRELIFGYMMLPSLKQRISELVERLYPHVELFEAQLNETEFDLDIVPYLKRSEG